MSQYVPKTPPEGINNPKTNSFKDVIILGAGTLCVLFALFWILGVLSGFAASKMSHSRMQQMFSSWNWSEDYKEAGVSLQLTERMQQLLDANNFDYKLKVYSFNEDYENAMIIPSGEVFFTKKLLDNAEGKAEIDFILCHELGHYHYKHGLKGLGRMILGALLLSTSGLGSNEVFAGLLSFGEMQFSQEQELEADSFALDCLYKATGKTEGYSSFFKRQQKDEFSETLHKVFKYQMSHPLNKERIEALDKKASKFFAD